jgi:hypothetical protein
MISRKTLVEYALSLIASMIVIALAWPVELFSWKMVAIIAALMCAGVSDQIFVSKRLGLWPWQVKP